MAKKQLWVSLALLALIFLVGMFTFPAFSKEKTNWDHVKFTAHESGLKFFDQNTGKIFVYSEGSGEVAHIWELKKLGDDLVNIK